MLEISVTLFWSLVGLVVGQAILVLGFCVALRRFRRPPTGDHLCPRASVVLCLRGSDPFLERCVEAIARQDYPCYDVRVVVDHRDDPAWEVVERTVRRLGAGNFRIEPLERRLSTCGLKCSAIVQAVQSLDDEVAFIAQLDADVIPHDTWLRELAGALSDKRVGAATGNRWYLPQQMSWGATVRYLWNAAAVVQMFSYRIAWGGTLAVKTSAIRQAGLVEKWSHAFCEDTMLFSQLRPHGLRVAFVPSLMMTNRENCDVGGFSRWVRRQLLTARLYHPGWPAVVVHGVVTFVAPLAALALGVAGAIVGRPDVAFWSLAGLAIYQVTMLLLIGLMEACVRPILTARGEEAGWLSLPRIGRLIAALPLTQWVYTRALLSALGVRRVDWRGVQYEIAAGKVRVVVDQPFVEETAASGHSL